MHTAFNQTLCRLLMVVASCLPLTALADDVATVGAVGEVDSKLKTLNANEQKNLRASNALGTNETKARAQSNCGSRFDKSIDDAAKNVATAAAPGDPVKRFNDAIKTCLDNIQNIASAIKLPTFSFTAAFETILTGLIDRLVNDVLMKICNSATGAWSNAVNNAMNTVNTGINQSGVNTFGTFVSMGPAPATPAPLPATPAAPAPMQKSNSTIPGL